MTATTIDGNRATGRLAQDGVQILLRPFRAAGRRLDFGTSLRVTLAFVVSAILLCLPLVGFGIWATLRVDGRAVEREAELVRAAFGTAVEAVSREHGSVTVSDEAVLRARRGDVDWMTIHLGRALSEFHGHSRSYVLDAADRPMLAVDGGWQVPHRVPFARDSAAIAPLAERLRAGLAAAQPRDRAAVAARDLVVLDGVPAIVSVRAILPESFRVEQPAGEEFLHVTLRLVDGSFLSRLEAAALVEGIGRTGRELRRDAPAVPIENAAGATIGHVVWTPERPGRQLVSVALPGLLVTITLAMGLVALLWRGLIVTIRRLKTSEKAAVEASLHDPLTGLPNRPHFNRLLAQATQQVGRHGSRGIAVHYIDLDGFKEINDGLGHAAGDMLIRSVADRLASLVQPDDRVARLGGDEFAVIQARVPNEAEAESLSRHILAAFDEPFDVDGHQVTVGCSIGIATSEGADLGPDELMRRADVALYQAKGAGRRHLLFFDRAFDESQREKRELEQALSDALDRNEELYVAYQPIFDASGSRVLGAEALLRWTHPERGPISPGVFVPVAEERGLMDRLGEFVLVEACKAVRRTGLGWVAVNVSAAQVRVPGFADRVLGHLAAFDLSPAQLQIEITESLLLDATHTVSNAILKLRLAGVKISLDDFGTGFSSLGYLTRLQVDKIKIDRSFVRGLGSCENGDAIVKAMIDLAGALSLDVTAEGVETDDEWHALERLGSPEIQGFLFSKPLEEPALRSLLAARDGHRAAAGDPAA